MLHIIVTGPESSGKTTLAESLARQLKGVLVPEYARGYLEAVGRRAVPEDFDHLVDATERLLASAKTQGTPAVVQDTGFEVLRLWMDDKFGGSNDNVCRAWKAQSPDLYILCRPDLAWEYDELREDPHRRDELFTQLRALIDQQGTRVVEASGFGESRAKNALLAIKALD